MKPRLLRGKARDVRGRPDVSKAWRLTGFGVWRWYRDRDISYVSGHRTPYRIQNEIVARDTWVAAILSTVWRTIPAVKYESTWGESRKRWKAEVSTLPMSLEDAELAWNTYDGPPQPTPPRKSNEQVGHDLRDLRRWVELRARCMAWYRWIRASGWIVLYVPQALVWTDFASDRAGSPHAEVIPRDMTIRALWKAGAVDALLRILAWHKNRSVAYELFGSGAVFVIAQRKRKPKDGTKTNRAGVSLLDVRPRNVRARATAKRRRKPRVKSTRKTRRKPRGTARRSTRGTR